MKYLVLKNQDIENAVNGSGKKWLEAFCNVVGDYREAQGKKDNIYLVLNTDESYAPEVFALMFKHGHTPCNDCKTVPQTCDQEKCQWLPILISAYGSIFEQKETP